MLRIARVKKSAFIQPDSDQEKIFSVLSAYGDLTKLVKQHLSPVTASIFAIPTAYENSDEIEWSSELKGQPVPLASLAKEEKQQAKKLLNDRISAIARLADELPKQTPETERLLSLLKQALHYPGDDAVYVVNGQPVITFWGIGDTAKGNNLSSPAAAAIPLTNETEKIRKIPRFLSILGWLALLALLAFLLWYWFAKNPVNWNDYNPFIDEYQQLVDEIEAANDDCLILDKIYQNNILLQRPEEKFILVKAQVEQKLAVCEAYRRLVKDIAQAQGNCPELSNILTNSPYLQDALGMFAELKQQLENDITLCEFRKLEAKIEQAANNCHELNNILQNNNYLQSPEGPFIGLKEQLKGNIQLCEYNSLKSKIQASSGDCPALGRILKTEPYIQNPQGRFAELKQKVERSISLCTEYKTLKSKIESAKDNCDVLNRIEKEDQYLQNPESMFVELKQKTAKLLKRCEDYQSLANEIKQAGKDCKKLQQLAKENDYLQNAKGKFADLKRQLDRRRKPCEKKKIEDLVNLCPGQRPKKLAPELVVVFDASGSMRHPAEASSKLLSLTKQLEQAQRSGNPLGVIALGIALNAEISKYGPSQSRMYAAKKAVSSLVPKIPSDMNTGLVVLKQCSRAQKYRFYAPNERQLFLREINRLTPTKGTPLGSGLSIAGQMVDGVKKPATIIVISDGEESCNANPCAIARQLAKNKPYLTINVVDIMGTGAGNCLARATKKGKVYTARNMRDIVKMTEQAASSAIPKHCKK